VGKDDAGGAGRCVDAGPKREGPVLTLDGARRGRGGLPPRSRFGGLASSDLGLDVHPHTAPRSVAAGTPSGAYQPLQLSIAALPHAICVCDAASCVARTGESQVTLTAVVPSAGFATWPAVQVAFVIETTPYDAVFDPGETSDACSTPYGDRPAREESNGVPFFVAHAQQIADAIQQANPHTNVSFAMVDYFATLTDHDDGDGQEYHVDIPQFISSQSFGSQVVSTFQATQLGGGWEYSDSDMSDNLLHSSVITALYGTIIGSGLDWSPATHHVIVWMGDMAPRDPNYVQNYAVSMSDYQYGTSATCEPAYSFGALTSPNCEGWVRSQDGNKSHSIAQLARTSPTCTDSIGAVCTVDTIDLYSTPTDPYSKGWPCNSNLQQIGGCPGGAQVLANTAKVLLAGCDLAAATGGTWDGPNYFSCPNGDVGHLQPVFVGPSAANPNLQNPTLFQAFRGIGFGPVISSQVANGTHNPIFQFIPYGNIKLVPNQPIVASCLLPNGEPFPYCAHNGSLVNHSGVLGLGWNWSNTPKYNKMYLGDVWTVSFLVYAAGPPTTTVPVDACVTLYCRAGGSGALTGLYTWATYIPVTNNTVITQSFPLATLNVEALPGVPPPPTPPPPPPPVPPPFGIPVAPPVPVLTAVGITAQVGVASVSLQAVSAGFLGAGFIRVTIRNKPIANPVMLAQYKNQKGSIFERQSSSSYHVGRFD
jgi:hypothetical protein